MGRTLLITSGPQPFGSSIQFTGSYVSPKFGRLIFFQTLHRVIDIRKQRSWMRQRDDGEAAPFRLIAGALRPAEMLGPFDLAANQLRSENLRQARN